jgi:hypothetical protein
MKRSKLFLLSASVAAVIGSMAFSFNPFKEEVDFNTDVKPILNKHCVACHGGVKKAANLSFLFSHEAIKLFVDFVVIAQDTDRHGDVKASKRIQGFTQQARSHLG